MLPETPPSPHLSSPNSRAQVWGFQPARMPVECNARDSESYRKSLHRLRPDKIVEFVAIESFSHCVSRANVLVCDSRVYGKGVNSGTDPTTDGGAGAQDAPLMRPLREVQSRGSER